MALSGKAKRCASCWSTDPPNGSAAGRFSRGAILCGPCRDKARNYGSDQRRPNPPAHGSGKRCAGQRAKTSEVE